MHAKVAEIIADCCDGEVYENYSGRGMFGKKTTGVVINSPTDVITHLLRNIHDISDEMLEAEDECSDLEINDISMDNLGLNTIIY